MSTELRVPLTEIRVKFRVGTRRPITELDRLVMQAIATGANSVSDLAPIFQLPERLLVECLIDLMDMALLALDIWRKRISPDRVWNPEPGTTPDNLRRATGRCFGVD